MTGVIVSVILVGAFAGFQYYFYRRDWPIAEACPRRAEEEPMSVCPDYDCPGLLSEGYTVAVCGRCLRDYPSKEVRELNAAWADFLSEVRAIRWLGLVLRACERFAKRKKNR